MVTLRQVSKTYRRGTGTIHALRDVSIEIERGGFSVFVGPSGCGKSTLLNLIGGLDLPTSGDILLDGISTRGFSSGDWTDCRRHKIGIVFQAFHLIPGLTAEENVALPLLLRGTRGADVDARVADVLETVGMTGRRRHRPAELSGGEQQRVAIARALVHRPGLILADEPTGNLDSLQGTAIIGLLRMLPERFGSTVILVTHSQEAARQADVVWMMRDGRVVGKTPAVVTV